VSLFIIGLILTLVLVPQDANAWEGAAWAAFVIVEVIADLIGAGTVATVAAGYVLAGAIYVGGMVGISFSMSSIAQALTGGGSGGGGLGASAAQTAKETSTRGQLINTSDSQVALPLIYGRQRVGINRVYMGVSGVQNELFHIVGTVCEGPIEGIAVIDGVPQIYLNDKIYTEYGSAFSYVFMNGTSTQNECGLSAYVPQWSDNLRNTAYIWCTLLYDTEVYSSLPEITIVIDGLHVYQPALGYNDFTDNAALCARDFMTRRSCRGGMELASDRINDDAVAACAAYCTAKGWTANLCILENGAVIDNLQQVLSCFRGDVVYDGLKFIMKYIDLNYESSVMDIDEDDIVEVNGISSFSIVQPDIFQTPNAIRIKYYNENKTYQIDDYVFADTDAIIADGDYREKEIYLRGVTSLEDAQKHANYNLERLRYNKTISFIMGSRGIALEPYDIIRVSVAVYGWSLKLFRVMEVTMSQDGHVAITAVEELASMYDDTYNPSTEDWHDTTLPSILDPIPSVGNVILTEEVYYYRNRSYTRLNVAFTAPTAAVYPQWSYADVYVKIGSAGEWRFMTKAVSSYVLDPVEEGETYYICLVSCTAYGSKQAFADGATASKLIIGASGLPPTSLTSVSVAVTGNTVKVWTTPVSDPDIAFYEVRSGLTWAGGTLVGRSISGITYLPGVKPGSYTFWMNTCDTSGLYGETPRSTTCTVYQPISESLENEWTWDFSTGTDSNTEQVTHDPTGDNFNALKCSHTSDVLTGSWTSVEYDLSAIKTVRIEGDFLTHYHAGTATWANTLGSKTWAEWGADTKTWSQLFNMDSAGSLSAVLYYGETSPPTNTVDISAVLSPTVSARYVKVVVTITDPVLDANLYLKDLNMKAYAS
jgi:hypothetical protein